jgi:hypothetical protein
MGSSLLAGGTLLGLTGPLGLFSDWAIRATLILFNLPRFPIRGTTS